MKTVELLLIVSIIVLVLYIIIRWLYKKKHSSSPPSTKEGMENLSYPSNMAFNDPENLPLKEYSVYASFNTGYDGTQISMKQLGIIMYGGCRFIDLNVFHSEKDLYVGFSNDNAPTMVEYSVKLSKVVEYLNQYAFSIDEDIQKEVENTFSSQLREFGDTTVKSGQTIQKTYIKYPLFVNIRVYRPPDSDIDILKLVSDALIGKNGLKKLYRSENGEIAQEVNKYTMLNDIRDKIILCLDYENILQMYSGSPPYDPTRIPPEVLLTARKTANIQIGSNNWYAFYNYPDLEKNTYNILEITNASVTPNIHYETNTNNMKLIYPYFTDVSNPDSYKYITKYKIQTIPNRFYINDANLTNYVNLFTDNKTPFVSLYHALNYIKKKNLESTGKA
jgi:hypothetical protein